MKVRIESTALGTGGPQSTKDGQNRQRTIHTDQDRPIGRTGSEGAGNSKKVRTEVNKTCPTKVAIVLLGIRGTKWKVASDSDIAGEHLV